MLRQIDENKILASHPQLGEFTLQCEGAAELLFTENESNASRLWGQPNPSPYVKDAFHEYVIAGKQRSVNPAKTGTKAAAHYVLDVPAGGSRSCAFTLECKTGSRRIQRISIRSSPAVLADADEFYERITPRTSAKMNVACIGRRWRACCGPSSITISISIDG